jgi:hypothetical protein
MQFSGLFFAFLVGAVLASPLYDPEADDSLVGTPYAEPDVEDPFVGTPSIHPIMAPRVMPDATASYEFTGKDFRRFARIITGAPEDGLGFIAEQLEGYSLDHRETPVDSLLSLAIRHHRPKFLELLLSHLAFKDQVERDETLSLYLTLALHHSDFVGASLLLGQIHTVRRQETLWKAPAWKAKPWALPELQNFVICHAERVAELVPKWENLAIVRNAEAALLLVELAVFCDAFLSPEPHVHLFDATYMMHQLLHHSTFMTDAVKAVVARRLLDLGADPSPFVGFCMGSPAGLAATCAVIWQTSACAYQHMSSRWNTICCHQ